MQVLARLEEMQPLPSDIELIEGGLAGLNLLPFLERGGRVVFVDAVSGFTRPDEIVQLDRREIRGSQDPGHFDHGAGLSYLLAVLPWVCEKEMPEEIVLVGLEGKCSRQTIDQAARLSVQLAAHGSAGPRKCKNQD